ncbi:hypothetical protein An18g06550 [Aspergillus niger]|uniref:Uncharacterized protein n=2 Tax=Aspergillus niger TaxID=5061 RepID=A2RBF6_ASPNC|nr:hypothetical protein An18g06550 [Aspergillus niger]CAK47323.1 hypothetical protein An18g06550 [Aspergillus niger]
MKDSLAGERFEGRGTDGLEVTGSDRRCLTTVAHTSSLLKPDKGPTCNLVARQISRRGGCWPAHHWLSAKAPTVHEGQLSANNQSEMVDLLLHGAAGLHVAATSTRPGLCRFSICRWDPEIYLADASCLPRASGSARGGTLR